MKLTPFTPAHAAAAAQLIEQVFTDSEGADEGRTIGTLVAELIATTPEDELLGVVAEAKGELLGALFLTPLKYPGSQHLVYLLSPVAVSTSAQKQGVGQNMIRFGIELLREHGVEVLVTYGDPNYYAKTGFEAVTEELVEAPLNLSFPHGWLARSLTDSPIPPLTGKPSCAPALNAQKYW